MCCSAKSKILTKKAGGVPDRAMVLRLKRYSVADIGSERRPPTTRRAAARIESVRIANKPYVTYGTRAAEVRAHDGGFGGGAAAARPKRRFVNPSAVLPKTLRHIASIQLPRPGGGHPTFAERALRNIRPGSRRITPP